MTCEEMRIAIAESLGKVERLSDEQFAAAIKEWESEPEHPHSSLTRPVKLRLLTKADYPNDLNAMAEVEKTLTGEDIVKYTRCLISFTGSTPEPWVAGSMILHGVACMNFACATATQRCEAYLHVKGLWRE